MTVPMLTMETRIMRGGQVYSAPVKKLSRMREKLLKYDAARISSCFLFFWRGGEETNGEVYC